MDTSNISPSIGGAIPARLGLPRRSSFDPLSTSSSKKGLSLGTLPGPSFAALPSGLRSVPALDSSRSFGSAAFRNVSTPLGDGQRTPGGSLVVGAEVFGFGKHAPRDSSERRRPGAAAGVSHGGGGGDSTASGSVDGLDEVLSTAGSARLGGTAVPAGWRASNHDLGRQTASSSDDLRLRSSADDARFRKGLDRLSADFAAAGGGAYSSYHLKTSGSAMDLRSASPASASLTDPLRNSTTSMTGTTRPSLLPQSSYSDPLSSAAATAADNIGGYGGGADDRSLEPSVNGSSSANGHDPSTGATSAQPIGGGGGAATIPGGLNPPSTTTTTQAPSPSVYAAAAEAISSPNSGPYLYPYQPPDPSPPPLGNPYFMAAMSPPPPPPHHQQPGYPHPHQHQRPPNEGMYASFGQASTASANATEEDLSYAMRGMQLGAAGGGGVGAANNAAGQQRSPQYSPEPYSAAAHARQDSAASFQPYYLTAASPYLAHPAEMYVTQGGMQYAPAGPGYYAAAGPPPPSGPVDASSGNANAGGPPPGVGRRDSITPQWGTLTMPAFALPPDFVGPSSRHGSFSFGSPMPAHQAYPPGAGGPAAPPTATFGGVNAPLTRQQHPPPPQAQANGLVSSGGDRGPYGMQQQGGGPQIGQQHQIILGRGVRAGQEYVAPGPIPPHGYGMGYAPDVRQLRSPLLEEFRSNRNRSWELQDLAGYIVEFSGDQLGSRHIQTKLDEASLDEKAMVFNEILPNMLQLSTDVFANYVIQKFFEQGSQVQKTAMAKVLEGHVLQLSLQMYGCRVVQKALEYVLVDQQIRLVKELDGHVLKCARDAQSNHVIQRALERVPPQHLVFITDACLGEVRDLATHPYGCRVLQRIFENCPPTQTRALLDELHRYVQDLVEDQYGNYVIQWVIEKGDPQDRSLVVAKLYGQVLPLAQQKFASNVVEKCIIHGSEEERRRLIEEVLSTSPDGSSIIKAMLTHPYANYVMQKCLACAKGAQRDALFAETAVQLTALRRYQPTPSKHLMAIEKVLSAERIRKGEPPLQFASPPQQHQHPLVNGGPGVGGLY
ncbi:hypothetical protein JCM10908_000443 [Rhodotorula pacifica]|uniref:Pumilio-family RNA binding repeat-containing protein n=1 Tax=Rhodotorula pacifica TaxID=1495444 RepID=UPI00317AB613